MGQSFFFLLSRSMKQISCTLVRNLLLLLTVVLLAACNLGTEKLLCPGETGALRHAMLLRMDETDGVSLVEVLDPWAETRDVVLQRYLLAGAEDKIPEKWTTLGAVQIQVPLERAVVMSSVHAALALEMETAGEGGAQMSRGIVAVADTAYIIRQDLKAKLRSGVWADAGNSITPDPERLLALRPDALLLSPMQNAGHGSVETIGVPIIECADYMEQTPLGRAEWMRFYARLFGCGEAGDSLFGEVERRYLAIAKENDTTTSEVPSDSAAKASRPRLLIDMRQGASWYVPGGKSYLAAMFADAGAEYFMAADTSSGSIPLDPETVLREAADADLWLIKYGAPTPLTYATLSAADSRYEHFAPYAARNIYVCNTLATPYYEDTPFRPDRLLLNLKQIIASWREKDRNKKLSSPTYFVPMPQ